MSDRGQAKVVILAGGTGETAERVLQGALTQFESEVSVETFTQVQSRFEIRERLSQAAEEDAFVVFTLLDQELHAYTVEQAEQLGVKTADLIGGLVSKLGRHLQETPRFATGLRHQLDAQYFKRVEAVEFAVKNDDGQHPQNLKRADMVLVGVSRTSKTPLSMYLAHKGYKVANVPLVPDIPAPKELFEFDQERIFALILDVNSLVRVRSRRLKQLGLPPDSEYAARANVARELRWVRDFYAMNPTWPVINTSGRAVEETAAELIRIMKERER